MNNPKDNQYPGWFKSRQLMRDSYHVLKPAYKDIQPEVTQTESERKGYEFEKHIVSLFNTDYFKLLEWRSDKSVNGICALSSKFPDLEFYFTSQSGSLHFAVECKWRQYYNYGMIDIAREDQLSNYREFQQITQIPVFIVLGVGGEANRPYEVYIIPLDKIEEPRLHAMTIWPFQRKLPNEMFFLNCSKRMLS